MIEISAEMVSETEKALKLSDGTRSAWVPRAQVNWSGKHCWIMPEWLAKEKGFI